MSATELNIMASRVVARHLMASGKYKKKTTDSEGNTQYEYSDKQVSHRNNEKATRIEKLRNLRSTLISQVKKDYKSSDLKTRMTALVVGLLDHTYERVGNDQSAKEGHFGITGWQAKHIKFNGSKATLNYIGKSGVKQSKEVKDSGAVALLKELAKGKSGSDCLFEHEGVKVSGEDVNAYLPKGITAKDLRGLHANEEMRGRLKAVRSKGPSLPSDPKAREKILKKELATALEETAQLVGHEPSTLKSQYLVPKMVDIFLQSGKVIDKLKVSNVIELSRLATKDEYEKDQEQTEDLLRSEPACKPPRYDLRKRRINIEDDPDLEKANATNDRDLSQNYKKIGKKDTLTDKNRKYPHQTPDGTKWVPYTSLTEDEKEKYQTTQHETSEGAPRLRSTAPKSRPIKKNVVEPESGGRKVKGPEDSKGKSHPGDELMENLDKIWDQERSRKKKKAPETESGKAPPLKPPPPEAFTVPEDPNKKKKTKYDEGGKKPKKDDLDPKSKKKTTEKAPAKKKAPKEKAPEDSKGSDDAPLSKDEIEKIIHDAVSQAVKKRDTPKKKAPKKKKKEDPVDTPWSPWAQDPKKRGEPRDKPRGKPSGKPKSTKSEGQVLGELLSDSRAARNLAGVIKGLGDKPTPKKFQEAFENVHPNLEMTPRASRIILKNFQDGKSLFDLVNTSKNLLEKEKSTTQRQVSNENAERIQMMLDETLSGAHLPNQEKKRFLNLTKDLTPQDQAVVLSTMRRNLDNRVGDVLQPEDIQGHIQTLRKDEVPKNPKDLGNYLADRLYAQNVVFNPFLTAGIPVSDQPKSDSELMTRASQSYDQFKDLGPKHRDRASRQIYDVLQDIDRNSPAAQEIKAISEGIALAATLKGESTEGLPPPSYLMTSVARALEKRGEERTLLGSMDPNSPGFRDQLQDHLREMSDEELSEVIQGDPLLDILGEQLIDAKGDQRRELRQMIEDVMVDHTKIVDPMIRDGLESKGAEDRVFDQEEREKIKREISQDQTGILVGIKEGLDKETRNHMRLNMMEATLRRISTLFGSMKKSMAHAMARKATNERDLNFLDHRTKSSVSRPKISASRVKSTSPPPRAVTRYQKRKDLLKSKGKKASQSFLYNESQLNKEPLCLKTAEPNSTRGDSDMSKTLTKQGAFQITQDLDKLAHVVQNYWEALGLPEKVAHDFAHRCDMITDQVEKTAFTEAPMTIKNDEGAKVPGTLKEDNTNADSPKQKFDPADIAKVKPPTRQESDEPYMNAFTQDENHQLENVQTSGGFSNSKSAAASKIAQAIVEALA